MPTKHSDFAATTLAADFSDVATTMELTSATDFPTLNTNEDCYVVVRDNVNREIVKISTFTGDDATTIDRAQFGTSAQSFLAGSRVLLTPLAGVIDEKLDKHKYTAITTAAGTTTLTSNSTYYQYFTGATTQDCVMPVVSTLYTGKTYIVMNKSSDEVTVKSSGSDTILVIASGKQAMFICITITGTSETSWDYIELGTAAGGGGGTPGGSNTQVQYNASGSFAGHSGFTYNGSGTVTINNHVVVGGNSTAAGYVDFLEDTDNGAHKIKFAAPDSVTADRTQTMQDADGTVALTADLPYVFKTISVSGQTDVVADGVADILTLIAGSNVTITTNAAGDTITIAAAGGGSGSPGGSTSQVQYNSAGSFAGHAGMTYDGAGGMALAASLSVGGNTSIGGFIDFFEDADNGSSRIRVRASSFVGSNKTLTLPEIDGTLAAADSHGNLYAENFLEGYQPITTSGGNTGITVSSLGLWVFTGSSTETATLPPASDVTLGHSYTFLNISSNNVTINASGGSAVQVMAASTIMRVICTTASGSTPSSWTKVYRPLDQTGTGAMVAATSPTLITPTLGVATATSIDFGGGALNTYASGTFTPVFSGASTPGSPTGTFAGRYVKIGKKTHVTVQAAFTNLGGMVGQIVMSGLPFTVVNSAAARSGISIAWKDNFTASATTPMGLPTINSTTILFYKANLDNTTLIATDLTNTTAFYFDLQYEAST